MKTTINRKEVKRLVVPALVFLFLCIFTFGFLIALDSNVAFAQQTAGNGAAGNTPAIPTITPGTSWIGKIFGNVASEIMGWIGVAVYAVAGWLLAASGWVLDIVVNQTVIEMATNVRGLAAVRTAWVAFRSIANMVFIFLLVFVAISTILRIEQYGMKRLLPKIVITALLLNFSIFIAGIIIDSSNLVAVHFAKTAINCEGVGTCSLSTAVLSALKLQTTNDASKLGDLSQNITIFVFTILGSIFMLITAFVLFIFSILLITRFVILIFILILSPLAFVGMVLPGIGVSKKWWKTLFDQAFFAPLFFMLMLVVLTIISDKSFADTVLGGPSGSLTEAFATASQSTVRVVLNYIIVTTFLIAALVISKTLANSGGGAVQSFVKFSQRAAGGAVLGTAAFAGRNTIGRIANSGTVQRIAARVPLVGSFTTAAMDKVAKSSFDVRKTTAGGPLDLGTAKGAGGYAAQDKRSQERYKRQADVLKDVKVGDKKAQSEARDDYHAAVDAEQKLSPAERKQAQKDRDANEEAIEQKDKEEVELKSDLADATKKLSEATTQAAKDMATADKAKAEQGLRQLEVDRNILIGNRDDVAKAQQRIEEVKGQKITGRERMAEKMETRAGRFGGKNTIMGRLYTGIVSPSAVKTGKEIRESIRTDIGKDERAVNARKKAEKAALENQRRPAAQENDRLTTEIKNLKDVQQKYGTADLTQKQQELVVAQQDYRDAIVAANQKGQYVAAEEAQKQLAATEAALKKLADHLTRFGATADLGAEVARRETRTAQLQETLRTIDQKIAGMGEVKDDTLAQLLDDKFGQYKTDMGGSGRSGSAGSGGSGGGSNTPPKP